MRFFDFHTHCEPGWAAEIAAMLNNDDIVGLVCCTALKTGHGEFETANRGLFELSDGENGGKLNILATVHINQPDWREHLTAWLDRHPYLLGVKLHPPISGYKITKELTDPLFELANERGLVIASHTCPEPGLSAIDFAPSLKRFPDTNLIIYHGSRHEDSAYLANQFRNVFVEPSWLGYFPNLFQMMAQLGPRKLLAGTDGPGWFSRVEDPYGDLERIVTNLMPDEKERENLLVNNAVELLERLKSSS